MKKIATFLASGILLFSVAACNDAKTSSVAPNSTQDEVKTPSAEEAKDAKQDATSETRRKQLNEDIRAREQRNNTFNAGAAEKRSDKDVASEVRSKLEANIPASALVVETKNGVVTVSGTVPTQQQYDKIANLTKEIKGVQGVEIKATVAAAKTEKK
ncbi:BON domain-containing protein [Nostocaceae cyanobacterium CENA369]|uniref:BON domain-containing protein n=1 Tax=Dendronalium phyllosphericum CENA369 TaxID=1725256 RepID=A0A8J7I0Y9_9NOST|nr:BON domain-containing protein [Dendronalium phyllosphericum]MBH8572133.1 BON domain-containing protein [Dendronalium phyllosphericum CENA369]